MSLRTDANELLSTLKEVVASLQRYEHPSRAPYGDDMAARLAPAVSDLERAVVENRSRDAAVAAMDEIEPLMHNINGASTKGGLNIFPGYDNQVLDSYWRLETIFRESRYAAENL